MQPGRPAYPHWGSSHPPTSAQTPTRNQKRPQNDKEDATDSLQQLIAFLLEIDKGANDDEECALYQAF